MILKNIKGLESSPLRIIEADELKEFIPKLQRVGTVCLVDYSQSPGDSIRITRYGPDVKPKGIASTSGKTCGRHDSC